jgi:UDP-N-acetyl-D-glucosamine dehydrogenase
MPFYPGPGVGGHCIPLDPTYLAWQSRRDTGRPFKLVEMAQDINASRPQYVASRIIDVLNDNDLSVRKARVLVLGVTYKPDVGDLRESAAIEVMAKLAKRGADVRFHDPFVTEVTEHGLHLQASQLTDAALRDADLVAVLTPHTTYDLDVVVSAASLVFDARNAVAGRHPHVTRL